MIETDIISGPIRYRDSDHSYSLVSTGQKLHSVSEIISVIYSTKSWDGVKPEIVENARIRGVAVDGYLSAYIRQGTVTVEGASQEIRDRTMIACRIFEEQFPGLPAESQKIVYSL